MTETELGSLLVGPSGKGSRLPAGQLDRRRHAASLVLA